MLCFDSINKNAIVGISRKGCSMPTPTSEPEGPGCTCATCGQPVHPNPLTLTPGALRGYLMHKIVLDATSGTPRVARYLKCAPCLGLRITKRLERYEALMRLDAEMGIGRKVALRRDPGNRNDHNVPLVFTPARDGAAELDHDDQ